MGGAVEVGAEAVDVAGGEEAEGFAAHFGAVVAAERQEIELEPDAHVAQVAVFVEVVDVVVALGVGQQREVAFGLDGF